MLSGPRHRKGEIIDERYLVHHTLRGGMGDVYLCLDLRTNQPYALKTLQDRFLDSSDLHDAFRAEVATWIALEKHPNIVRCYFLKTLGDQPYIFLEWIASGERSAPDLRSRLQYGPLDLRSALEMVTDVCRGLIHADQKRPGIVHRDLKPENILVSEGRVAKITDFGLAQIVEQAQLAAPSSTGMTTDRQSLAALEGIVGTPAYMAPEQWAGVSHLDARTDIYALGCVLFEMLAGRRPFGGSTRAELRRQHLEMPPPRAEHVPFPPTLEAVIARCLAKHRDERFPSVAALLEALNAVYCEAFSVQPRSMPVDASLSADDHYNRGLSYYALQRYAYAVEEYTRGLARAPSDVGLYLHRGIARFRLGQLDSAFADYGRAIELDPGSAMAYTNRGSAYVELGRYDEALADYARAIQLDPHLASAYFNRGNTWYRLQRYDEALADYNRAVASDANAALAYTNRGNVYATLGRESDALADYTRAIELNPSHVRAYFNRALLYVKLGLHDAAIADLHDVLRLDPDDIDAYVNIGALLGQQGVLSEALHYFAQAAQRGDTTAATYVAQIRWQLGTQEV